MSEQRENKALRHERHAHAGGRGWRGHFFRLTRLVSPFRKFRAILCPSGGGFSVLTVVDLKPHRGDFLPHLSLPPSPLCASIGVTEFNAVYFLTDGSCPSGYDDGLLDGFCYHASGYKSSQNQDPVQYCANLGGWLPEFTTTQGLKDFAYKSSIEAWFQKIINLLNFSH